jgi:hypothetical protein
MDNRAKILPDSESSGSITGGMVCFMEKYLSFGQKIIKKQKKVPKK